MQATHRDAKRLTETQYEYECNDSWLVVWAKPNCERKVQRWAQDVMGERAYCPVYETRRKRVVLLFPRYVFVQEGNYDPVSLRYTPGVSDLVRSGDRTRFARLSNRSIEQIRETETAAGVVQERAPLSNGEHVQVKMKSRYNSALSFEIVGMFIRMQDAHRAIVLTSLFGRQQETPVELERIMRFEQ